MNDILTITEMESRFADEWILVGNPETNDALEVQRGKVLCHGKDRDEVYRQALELRPERFAMLFTGQIRGDAAVVL